MQASLNTYQLQEHRLANSTSIDLHSKQEVNTNDENEEPTDNTAPVSVDFTLDNTEINAPKEKAESPKPMSKRRKRQYNAKPMTLDTNDKPSECQQQ